MWTQRLCQTCWQSSRPSIQSCRTPRQQSFSGACTLQPPAGHANAAAPALLQPSVHYGRCVPTGQGRGCGAIQRLRGSLCAQVLPGAPAAQHRQEPSVRCDAVNVCGGAADELRRASRALSRAFTRNVPAADDLRCLRCVQLHQPCSYTNLAAAPALLNLAQPCTVASDAVRRIYPVEAAYSVRNFDDKAKVLNLLASHAGDIPDSCILASYIGNLRRIASSEASCSLRRSDAVGLSYLPSRTCLRPLCGIYR